MASAQEAAPSSAAPAHRAVRLAAMLTLLLSVAGAVAIYVVGKYQLWRRSIFYEQFAAIEWPGIAILAGFAVAVLVLLRRPAADADLSDPEPSWLRDTVRARIAIALGVLIITAVGTHLVFHDYLFMDDEYSGWFQSIIYSRGHRVATVPAEWCPWISSLIPTSVTVSAPCTWHLSYLPIHALIRGAFLAIRADTLAEPTLAALCIVLVVLIARRAWPDRPQRAILSALFLAASTQFLVMAMTGFAMTAHLFFSLLWLWVYLNPGRWAPFALPWVGVLALGVHSPTPHILFVAPFLLRLLIQRWAFALFYAAPIYIVGLAFWMGKLTASRTVASVPIATPTAVKDVAVSIATHPTGDGITGAMSLTLLATWSVPVVLLCVLVALLRWQRLDGISRWIAVSAMFTIGARAVFFSNQGGGWGSRYAFAILGNLVILAAIGTELMAEALGRRRTYSLVAVSLAAALLIQFPLRGVQAERIVRPYYEATRWMQAYDADVVAFPGETVRWGRMMLHNDPFLRNRPKLMSFSELGQVGVDSLEILYPGRVRQVTRDELVAFGLKRVSRIGRFELK